MSVSYHQLEAVEQELVALEATIARARSRQAELLAWMDQAQVNRVAGSRSLEEWTASRLDVVASTARDLVRAARRHGDYGGVLGETVAGLEAGEVTFDRAVATRELLVAGATRDEIDESFRRDLAGVRRLAARKRRVTRQDEREIMRRRHLVIDPTLGETAWRIGGLAPGYDGRVILKALEERADRLPEPPPGESEGRGPRMLDALTALAQDFLDGVSPTDGLPVAGGSSVTLFLDADAGCSNGELGGTVAAGPRVGPDTIGRVLCEGEASVVGLSDGRPVETTDSTKAIQPAVRDFVLQRDGGCVIDGCRSRYRLQPHHIRHRAHQGDNDPDNLATLCWYHHHIAVHGYGKVLDPESPPLRRRFIVGPTRDPPWY